VFLKLWVKPESYVPGRGKFSGWLLTLVHNRSVDRLRRAKTGGQNNNIPLDMDNGNGLTVADMLPDQAATPYEEAWRAEKGSIVREALKRLPASQRDAISLAYFGGLTQREIAERLGEPLGTIKTRTRSGLMALKRVLGNQGALGELE
jgi:RNA polymerase sigma-70 factor (ECF subfamily)